MKKIFTILIMCFGGTLAAQSYHVGDIYTAPDGSQGVVFYVHPDGSGGWVVALNDASEGCPWGLEGDIPGLTNLHPNFIAYYCYLNLQVDTSGFAYTQTIRNFQNNDPTYAAGLVDFANGWYLPSYAQLLLLYGQMPFIADALTEAGGATLANGYYWSSSERDASTAWRLANQGGFENTGKTDFSRVRAVRNFSYEEPQPELSYSWSTGDQAQDIIVIPTQTTTYKVTVTTPGGCSDTVAHTVTVGSGYHTGMLVTWCDEYEWNGQVYTEDGDYDQTFTAANGCDSVVTLHLTLDHGTHEVETVTTCDSYEWNGQTYTQSGDYDQTFVAANGCDSVVSLHLTIEQSPSVETVSDADTVCVGASVTIQASAGSISVPAYHVPPVAVGDILCTDGTFAKPSDWPVAGKTAVGVVCYVDNSGVHGWAIHPQDQGTSVRWAPSGSLTDISTLTNYTAGSAAIMDVDGYSNTQKIRAAGDATTCPAAYAVSFEDGWYLPASGQMRCIYSNMPVLNTSLQLVGGTPFSMTAIWGYWSSTESSNNNAWHLDENGQITSYTKTTQYRIRSARNF